jgi:hypothetical protein
MRPVFFKALGVATLFANALLFPTAIELIVDQPSDHTYRGLIAFSAVSFVGIGLIFLRKWAALYFSVPLFCFGFSIVLTAIPEVTFPFNLLAMCEGISLMLPLVVTFRVWRQLTWGGKWFF